MVLTRIFAARPDVPRWAAALSCMAAALACVAYDHWRKDLPDWWRGHGGGIPYVVFWIAFWFTMLPYRRFVLPICATVTAVTCLGEFTQLWQPAWLMRLRATRLGAALVGSGFTWSDLPPYLLGGVLGYLLLLLLLKLAPQPVNERTIEP